jgi:hypothetical protein
MTATTTMQGIQDKLGLSSKPHAIEEQLDNAVEDSFPASDPVSLAMPHHREELDLHTRSSTTMWLVGGGLLAIVALIALRR